MTDSNVEIIEVESRRDKRAFLSLPWQLYKGDPHWIPPLRMNQKELVGYAKHPFHDQADVQTFLAKRDGKPVGRIAAIIDHGHNEYNKERRGFFGFFESIDDQQVADELFTTVRNWLNARDIHLIRGPVNPSMNYECGLLVDGFDSSPQFMMTYNHDYYPRLVENFGFKKAQDMYAFWGHTEMLHGLDEKLLVIAEEAMRRLKVKTRTIDKSRFLEEIKSFMNVYNRALPGTWGFSPLSEAEVDHIAKGLRFLIVPKLTSYAEVDGKVIGTLFGMPNYNPRIRQIDGRLFPFGFIRLLWDRRKIREVRMISTNVVPEYQRWGVGLVLMYRLLPDILEWGIKEAEFSWVLESNHLSRSSLEKGGAKLTKTYRIYDFGEESVENSVENSDDREE